MHENKIPGIWKWSVLLLVLCNIGLIITIWLRPMWNRPPAPGGARGILIHSLNFSDEQVKKYDELIEDHQKNMRALRREAMEYRRILFSNLHNEPGGIKADSVAQLIAMNQKQTELVTYEHFRKVRELCNETQKAKFDDIITEIIKKMNGPGHGGPHPPPPPEDNNRGPHDDDRPGPPPGPGQNP